MSDTVREPVEAPAEPPAPRRRNWRKITLIALLLVGAVTLVAVPVYIHYSSRESTDDAQIEGHITSISPRVGGTIEEVLVKDNQFVKAGDVLVRIDPSDYHVALTRSQADLADALANLQAARTSVPLTATNARSSLANAQAGVSEAQTAVEGARAQVAAADARLNTRQAALREAEANQRRAEQDLARLRQLVEKDEISHREYDAAVATAAASGASTDAARAGVAEAERGVNVARSTVGQAEARVRQAQAGVQGAATIPQQVQVTQSRASSADARVQQAQASVKRAQLDLQYTIVRAPVKGIVSRRTAEVGQVVSANQQLMVVVPLDDLWVVANFKETQLKEMRPGQKVEIGVDAFGGRKFYGRVDSIAGATGAKFSMLPPENATGNYVKVVQRVPVKIVFDRDQDPEHRLRPGMSVEPTVLLR